MSDFNKPQVGDPYGDVLQAFRDLLIECAKFQDGSTNTNVPVGAIRFSSANKRFEKWNGKVGPPVKLLAQQGLCSRREADSYIERGWVKVDGVVATLGEPAVRQAMAAMDVEPRPTSLPEFRQYMDVQFSKWKEAVDLSGAKVD